MTEQRITDEITAITDCHNDIELMMPGCDDWNNHYWSLTNNEMQSLIVFWLRELPEDQRAEQLRQITEAANRETVEEW